MADTVARRAEPPARTRSAGVAGADATYTFAVARRPGDDRTAQQWARSVFEDAPAPMPTVLLLGWRTVLRLRSRPRTGPGHVLGWRIRADEGDLLVLEQDSGLIAARNVVQVDGELVSWSTTVEFAKPAARLVWAVVLPFHLVTIPRLLARAARRGGRA
ncbi:DUF2867 domain-containing protein [Tsukamurella sp. M9C]|uniref:DUF2867 domain-containing protein n=1 Tax=unclassified Tsukamurella TaxID=2633480 RepID=UPI001CCFCF0A|nr:DUF2867 domain-containing protein [Tsukamurella sp. M9C]MCA0154683.1 DUF2867 domain-containing protein [Tsukamurella sp. M9C]